MFGTSWDVNLFFVSEELETREGQLAFDEGRGEESRGKEIRTRLTERQLVGIVLWREKGRSEDTNYCIVGSSHRELKKQRKIKHFLDSVVCGRVPQSCSPGPMSWMYAS